MPLQRQEVPEEEEIQTMSLRREAVPEEEEVQTMPLQRQAVPEEEEEMIQMTSLLQRRSDGSFEAGGEFERRLSGTRGEGQPLPPFTRTEFDAKFGVDFSGVRVHTGSESATLNRAIQAKAFTLGSDIHFGAGHYAPETAGGKQLLAHELAHVVQQGGAAIRRQPKPGLRKVDAGTLAGHESTEEEEVVKGPDDRVKLDGTGNSTRTASAPSAASPSAGNLPIAMGNIGFRFSNVGVTTSGSTTNRKDVRVAWKNPGGMAVDPFGEEAYRPSWKNANYTVNEGRLKLDFTLDINCPWGVNNGGKTDVPSATDAIVTAASYKQIVSDLTPVKIEKCWRAPRRQYWSQKVCERHEKYHSTDDKQWTEGPGRTLVINYLKGKTVSSNSIQADLTAHLDNAITQLSRANTAYYTGGATSYLSYAGEERAFGDGKEPYEQLAQGVKSQGEKLEAKAKKKWWQFWK
ncbi:MAG: DUF4157 domain-containing protein [Anaerolineae bacterium]|nr:DUF4157 domain-containing protein [Anaerolineae bacterium]